MSSKSSFYEVSNLNYKLSKIFGLCQFTIYTESFETRTTFLDVLVLLLWSFFYGYNCLNIYTKPSEKSKYTSTIYFIGISLCELTSVIIHICVLWLNFVYREATASVLRGIYSVDQQVNLYTSAFLVD